MNDLFRGFFGDSHLEEYCTGVFSDTLDKMGLRRQVLGNWKMNRSSLRLFGRIRTLLLETIETDDERISTGLGFLASLDQGDVLFVKGSTDYAYFGELMSRLSVERRLGGAVIDGMTRDTVYTQTIDFPIFAKGFTARDIKGRGRVAEVDVTFQVDGLDIRSGDFLFGDSDCLAVLPASEMPLIRSTVREVVKEEVRIKELIKAGTPISVILQTTKEF